MQASEFDRMPENLARLVERLERTSGWKFTSTDESWADSTFDRAWPPASDRGSARRSAWRSIRTRQGHSPSFHKSVLALIGHLLGSFLVFVMLLVVTWGVGFVFAWLNRHQPFSDEDLQVISKLKASMLYLDAILCAAISISGTWTFLKGTIR